MSRGNSASSVNRGSPGKSASSTRPTSRPAQTSVRERGPAASYQQMSGTGTKRNRLGAHGISGAECRPAVPSTWRHQPPVDPERNPGRPSRSAKTYTSHCSRVTAALAAWFLHDQGRVEVWRGGCRSNISVTAPFVWRCLTGSTLAPSPHTGSSGVVTHPRLPQNVACRFAALRSSGVGSQYCESLQRLVGQPQLWSQQR